MARGYIYDISTDMEEIANRTSIADEVSEHCDMLGIEYAKDVDEDELTVARQNFLIHLIQYEAETGSDKDPFTGEGIHWFILTDRVKENYFTYQYNHLLELIKDTDLTKFATQYQGKLMNCIEYDYGDCVWFNDFPETMDAFIREADTGVKYYVGTVAYMK